jgi:drug/metabolite transporter (DMT)-like permease
MSITLIGTMFGLASAIAWSMANLAILKSTRRFGPYGGLLGAQAFGGTVVLLIALAVEGVPNTPSRSSAIALAIAALAACLAYGGLFQALKRGAASVTAPIISAWSTISVAVEVFFFDRPLGGYQATGIALVAAGNVLLARYGTHDDASSPKPGSTTKTPRSAIVAAVVSAAGFGIMVPATERTALWSGPVTAVPIIWAGQWILLFAWLRLFSKAPIFVARPRSGADYRTLAYPGIYEAIGFLALTIGLARAPTTIVAPASSLSTAFTVALSVTLLGERLKPLAYLGAGAASLGVVFVNLG